jgi:CheY-like chemotaxis protein/Flp pilus assembly protein TadD
VQLRCQIAADFEHRGQYAAAHDALGELWRGVGQRPTLEGLTERTSAEVLLRAGALSGWLGSVQQIEGAQDAAKDLICESIARFKALAETTKVAAAQSELGLCYRRAGAYDEARVLYGEALKNLTDSTDLELRIKTLLRLVTVESCSGRYNDALRLLTESSGLFEKSVNDTLKGKFHNELGLVLRKLGTSERRRDYTDRAIVEYTAATFHFEEAGHTSYRARAENNLGFLLYTVGRYDDANGHLNNARILFISVKDKGSVAQVDETRASVLLAQGRTKEAERAIREAVRVLAKGGEQGLYAEALTTQGRVLAKLGNFPESRNTLRKAANIAEAAGAVEDAGRALLVLLEEHGERIDEREFLDSYQRADKLLADTQDAETIARLRACAGQIVYTRLAALPPRRYRSTADSWAGFNLPEKVHAYEARYIRRALIDAKGSITHAARLLGWDHHGTLQSMLDEGGRHHNLAHLRTPLEKRKKSIIGGGRRRVRRRAIRILHVEDHATVADAVRDALEALGWKVKTRADGAEAMKILEADEPFHVLIFDYDLPGHNGIELTRHARTLRHRRRTPIIIFTASDIEQEAWRVGASAVLHKPHELGRLPSMVMRLLSKETTSGE